MKWPSFSKSKNTISDNDRIKAFNLANNIVADFGELLENDDGSGAIQDVKFLPHDKKRIFSAICLLLQLEKDNEKLESLKMCAYFLSFYQPEVGEKPLYPGGLDFTKIDLKSIEGDKLLNKMADGEINATKFVDFQTIVDKDWLKMSSEISRILSS